MREARARIFHYPTMISQDFQTSPCEGFHLIGRQLVSPHLITLQMARPRHTVQHTVANQLMLRQCILITNFQTHISYTCFCASIISKFRCKVSERISTSGGLVYCDVSKERDAFIHKTRVQGFPDVPWNRWQPLI